MAAIGDTPTPEAVARNAAVTIVAGLYGYTMEFAPNKAEHRQMYRMVEDTITLALEAEQRATWEEAARLASDSNELPGCVSRIVLALRSRARAAALPAVVEARKGLPT